MSLKERMGKFFEVPSDLKTAGQMTFGALEVLLMTTALTSGDPNVRLTLGSIAGMSSIAALWAIDRHHLTKQK